MKSSNAVVAIILILSLEEKKISVAQKQPNKCEIIRAFRTLIALIIFPLNWIKVRHSLHSIKSFSPITSQNNTFSRTQHRKIIMWLTEEMKNEETNKMGKKQITDHLFLLNIQIWCGSARYSRKEKVNWIHFKLFSFCFGIKTTGNLFPSYYIESSVLMLLHCLLAI